MRTSIYWPLGIALLVAATGLQPSHSSENPTWRASDVLSGSEAIVVVHEAETPDAFTVEDWDDTGNQRLGTALNLVITESLYGSLEPGTTIRFFERPPHVHDMTYIRPGEQLIFLRRMTPDEIATINRHVEHVPVHLPAGMSLDEITDKYRLPTETWMLVSETFSPQSRPWMSHVRLDPQRSSGPLAAQLTRTAGIEPTKEAILTYIRELIELCTAATEDPEAINLDELDAFQQDVVRTALRTAQVC